MDVHFRKKSKCQRAACSKTRLILTRKTNCVHDLRVFPCNRSLWSSTRTRRLVHYEFAEWGRPRFRCTVGSSLLTLGEMPSDAILEGLYKSKLQNSFQLQTVMALYDHELHETMEIQTINDWRLLWNFILIRWWELEPPGPGTMLRNEDQLPRVKEETKPTLRGKVGECFQWKAHGQCSNGGCCSFRGQRRKKAIVFSRTPLEGKTD